MTAQKTGLCILLLALVACASPSSGGGGNPGGGDGGGDPGGGDGGGNPGGGDGGGDPGGGDGGGGDVRTPSFCEVASCTTLFGVKSGETILLPGNGFQYTYDAAGNRTGATPVTFTTDWGRGGSAGRPYSMTATTLGAGSGSELVRDGAGVDGYAYADRGYPDVAGFYNFVRAFVVNDAMRNQVYAGVHGFVPTSEALSTASGEVYYTGEVLGDIAYMPFTQLGSARVFVSGGTATIMANFGTKLADLTLTLRRDAKSLQIRYMGLAIEESSGSLTGNFASSGSSTLAVTVVDVNKTADFVASSSAVSGAFYGWDGRGAPAEVGGSVRLVGNDPANFANLLFLGRIGNAPPDLTPLSCTVQSCRMLSGVGAGETIPLQGRGFHHTYVSGGRTATRSVMFETEWQLVGSTPGPYSIIEPATGSEPGSELVRDGADVDGYFYNDRVVSGSYQFAKAFTFSPRAFTGSIEYTGVYGFVPTSEALATASGEVYYTGEVLGDIAYMPFTQLGSVPVSVSGGTATIMANFGTKLADLTLTLRRDAKSLQIRYMGLAIEESSGFLTGNFASSGSSTLAVTVVDVNKTADFVASSSAVSGTFYGWWDGRGAPAEVGGSVRLVGTDATNFANLLFLGKIGNAPPDLTPLSCTVQSCRMLSGVEAGETIPLQGRGFHHTYSPGRPTVTRSVMFGSEWQLVGSTPGPYSIIEPATGSEPGSELVREGETFKAGYVPTGVTGSYDYTRAFAIKDGGNEIYAGIHGFVPTSVSLATAGSGTYTYYGEAFGRMAYGDITAGTGAVDVIGGMESFIMTADFRARTAQLWLRFSADLAAIDKRLEIHYEVLDIADSWDFSSRPTELVVRVNGLDGAADFATDSSAASGTFYGWDRGREAPAEVGGRVSLVGRGHTEYFANLLFLGNIVTPTPPPDPEPEILVDLEFATNIRGYAITGGDPRYRHEGVTIARVESVWRRRSVLNRGHLLSVRAVSGLGRDSIQDSDGGTSNLSLDADFDGDPLTPESPLTPGFLVTEGYDYFRAFEGQADYAFAGPDPNEPPITLTRLYRGFHGLEFTGTWPTMGTARYRGRFLVIDYRNNHEIAGRPLDDIVMIKRVPGSDGRPETRVEVNIPADRLPSPMDDNNYISRGTDLSFSFTYTDTGDTSAKALSITQSESETLRGSASASFYGYDPNVFGPTFGGPDEVAVAAQIEFAQTNTETQIENVVHAFSVLVAAD